MLTHTKGYELTATAAVLLTLWAFIEPTLGKGTTIWRSADMVKTACDQAKEFNSTGKIPEPVKDDPTVKYCGWFKKGESCPSACCDIMFFRTCKNKPATPPAEARILNGSPARKYKFPSLVHVVRPKDRYQCGGSIYNEQWIITAAHCVEPAVADKGGYEITAAEYNYQIGGGEEQVIKSIKGIRHPKYKLNSNTASQDDIAMIKVEKPFQFNDKVGVAKLPAKDFFELGWAIALGWGNGHSADAGVLYETLQPLITTEECKKVYGTTEIVVDTHLCKWFKEGLTTFCAGDSGSPTYQCIDNELVQIGLNTWAVNDSRCELRGLPDVDTKISKYIDWIEEQVSKN